MKLLAVALALLLLAGCGTGTQEPDVLHPAAEPAPVNPSPVPSADPTPKPIPPIRCLTSGVEISLGVLDGAMGLRIVGLKLRNCGTSSYAVDGYPDVTLLDAHQRATSAHVLPGVEHVDRLEEFDKLPQRFVLAPGQTADAVVVWRNLTTDEDTIINGEYLRVALTSGQPTQLLALHVDLGNTGILAVSPWSRP